MSSRVQRIRRPLAFPDRLGGAHVAQRSGSACQPSAGLTTIPGDPAAMDHELRKRGTGMIAIIFEVRPADGRKGDYLELAARLKDELERMDGFISVERFQSLTDPDKLLSLSFWRDEEAVAGWRQCTAHRAAQSAGRAGIFRDYRLRVGAVARDYGLDVRREQAPEDSRAVHEPTI
jgi:heme-degrading monooxygenase HmoA